MPPLCRLSWLPVPVPRAQRSGAQGEAGGGGAQAAGGEAPAAAAAGGAEAAAGRRGAVSAQAGGCPAGPPPLGWGPGPATRSPRVFPRLTTSPRVSLLQVRQQELLLKLLQQQQAAAAVPASPAPSSPPPLWAGLAKQGLSMKTLLELQLEGERQLHKQPPPREPSRAQAPNHRVVSRRAGPSPTDRSAGLEPSGTPSSYSSQGDRG